MEPAPAAAPELAAEGFDAEGVYGVVVDEDARGVPGARVVLFDGSRRLSEQGESLAETSCDDEGSFRFRDLDICRSYMVYVTAADYLPGFEWLTSGHHEKIELRRAQVIRGRILEKKTREPIADALVYVDRWHYVFEEDDAPPTFEVQLKSLSGEDGSYELHGVRLEGNQEVKV